MLATSDITFVVRAHLPVTLFPLCVLLRLAYLCVIQPVAALRFISYPAEPIHNALDIFVRRSSSYVGLFHWPALCVRSAPLSLFITLHPAALNAMRTCWHPPLTTPIFFSRCSPLAGPPCLESSPTPVLHPPDLFVNRCTAAANATNTCT